ncbi:MAG: DUF3887 domain-containing protein [Deltaproteobacteria bacterium]|nr:DUF3887 domain-containing protein [Deltaproteobacteria bacterium]
MNTKPHGRPNLRPGYSRLGSRWSLSLWRVLLGGVLLGLAGCHIPGWSDTRLAKNAAETIFRHSHAGQFDSVYLTAAPEFKEQTPPQALAALMAAFDQQLGSYQGHELVNTSLRSQMGGAASSTQVVLTYRVTRERGVLATTMVFRIAPAQGGKNRQALLEQYEARDAPGDTSAAPGPGKKRST